MTLQCGVYKDDGTLALLRLDYGPIRDLAAP